jgi:hypothetical protein
MCAYLITRDGKRLAELGGLAVIPCDGLYSAARKWAEIVDLRLVEFQRHHVGGYSVAVLEDCNGLRQTIHVEAVRASE